MEAYLDVFADAVVEGRRFPGFGEEDHADCLAEVVELQACAADSGHDGGVGDDVGLDVEFAGAEDEVGVCCCASWVSGFVSEVFGFVDLGHTRMGRRRRGRRCLLVRRRRGSRRCRFLLVRGLPRLLGGRRMLPTE